MNETWGKTRAKSSCSFLLQALGPGAAQGRHTAVCCPECCGGGPAVQPALPGGTPANLLAAVSRGPGVGGEVVPGIPPDGPQTSFAGALCPVGSSSRDALVAEGPFFSFLKDFIFKSSVHCWNPQL